MRGQRCTSDFVCDPSPSLGHTSNRPALDPAPRPMSRAAPTQCSVGSRRMFLVPHASLTGVLSQQLTFPSAFVPQTALVHTPSKARAAHFPSPSSFNPTTVPPAALSTLPPHMTR